MLATSPTLKFRFNFMISKVKIIIVECGHISTFFDFKGLSVNKIILARKKRLSEGRCPIHGISMGQVDNEIFQKYCEHCKNHFHEYGRDIAKCCRKDCNIRAFFKEPHIDGELLPEFRYLLEE